MADIDVIFGGNVISLQGELTRHTLMTVSKSTSEFLLTQTRVLVDLQQVTLVDTAGLAWLFYIFEQAQKANCQLVFANLPTKLDNLINLSGVTGFLPK